MLGFFSILSRAHLDLIPTLSRSHRITNGSHPVHIPTPSDLIPIPSDPIPIPSNPTWANLEPIWTSFWTQFEALENERRSAAICPLLVRQDGNERLAAEWRLFLKAPFTMHSEGPPLRSHMPTFGSPG